MTEECEVGKVAAGSVGYPELPAAHCKLGIIEHVFDEAGA